MWITFSTGSDVYILNIINCDDVYNIFVSDLKDVWFKEYSKNDIINQFKESNPVIDIEAEESISQTLKILNEVNNALVTVNKSSDGIDLNVKSEITGTCDTKFKLKYNLNLPKQDKCKFTEVITVPMVHTINYLEKQQKVLCDLIRKKDRELEEYKMEKGLISRSDLMTEKFNQASVENSNEKLMLSTFGASTKFWESFVTKYGNIEASVMEVKVDPWNQVKRKRKVYNASTSAKKFAVAGRKKK